MNFLRYCIFSLCFCQLSAGVQVFAEEAPVTAPEAAVKIADFYGYWKINEPSGDVCYLFLRPGEIASAFWSGTLDNTISHGKVSLEGQILMITWESGYRYRIELKGEGHILREVFTPEMNLSDKPLSSEIGEKIDRRQVGMLTVDPTAEDVSASPVEATQNEGESPESSQTFNRTPFVGYWKITQNRSLFNWFGHVPSYYVHLRRDGRARSARSEEGTDLGAWTVVSPSEVQIMWYSGYKSILRKLDSGEYEWLQFTEDKTFTDSPKRTAKVARLNGWEGEQFFQSASVKRIIVEDVIGCWLEFPPKEASFDYTVLERWGKATRVLRDGSQILGSWRLSGESVLVEWPSGQRELIQYATDGFYTSSFDQGQALDSIPVRKSKATRIASDMIDGFKEEVRRYYEGKPGN
jgi:hypothetical protein